MLQPPAAVRSRKHPGISLALPPLCQQRPDRGRSALWTRRLIREQLPRQGTAARPDDALANEPGQSALRIRLVCAHGLKARNRSTTVDNQHRRASLEPVDESTQTVLDFSDTDSFHTSQNGVVDPTNQVTLLLA